MALSDEAKKKCDELAREHASQYWDMNADADFKHGFGAGYEFAKDELKDSNRTIAQQSITLIEAEKARSKRLVEALEFYASDRVPAIIVSNPEGELTRQEIDNLPVDVNVPDRYFEKARLALEAHKAGEK